MGQLGLPKQDAVRKMGAKAGASELHFISIEAKASYQESSKMHVLSPPPPRGAQAFAIRAQYVL